MLCCSVHPGIELYTQRHTLNMPDAVLHTVTMYYYTPRHCTLDIADTVLNTVALYCTVHPNSCLLYTRHCDAHMSTVLHSQMLYTTDMPVRLYLGCARHYSEQQKTVLRVCQTLNWTAYKLKHFTSGTLDSVLHIQSLYFGYWRHYPTHLGTVLQTQTLYFG